MSRATWIGGALIAPLAAGPVFSLALALQFAIRAPGAYAEALVGFGVMLMLSVPVGFLLALAPSLAGSALLAWSGNNWQLARHPLVWVASGGIIGWMLGLLVLGTFVAIPMSITGIYCALVSRMLASWPD